MVRFDHFKTEYIWTPGAGAATKDIPLGNAPIAAVYLDWYMLGQGAAATIANALTQCGTLLYLVDGSADITPEWTAAQLYEYHNHFFGRIATFQDGTAADNKAAYLGLVLPLGRPQILADSSFLGLVDPMVGWNPKSNPHLHIEVPADGSAIDGRKLKVTVLYANAPFPFTKRWTKWASQTLSTSAFTAWDLPDAGSLLEGLMYQTSARNGTLTSDAPTLDKFEFKRGGKSVLTDGEVDGSVLGALINSTPTPDDDYLYFALSRAPFDGFENCIMLSKDTKFMAYGGVADALVAAFSYIRGA